MKRGIIYADLINTVSPTYAKEIMTPEFGEGLEELLQKRKSGVYGMINGIDYDLWNPEADDLIKHHFSHKKLDVRGKNKEFLQKKFKLPNDPETFLVSLVSRMSTQKGFDLIEPVIRSLLRELRMQLVVVGEGDTTYMKMFQDFQNKLTWQELQKRAMQQDFSWQNSAKQYEKIIHKAERVDPEI